MDGLWNRILWSCEEVETAQLLHNASLNRWVLAHSEKHPRCSMPRGCKKCTRMVKLRTSRQADHPSLQSQIPSTWLKEQLVRPCHSNKELSSLTLCCRSLLSNPAMKRVETSGRRRLSSRPLPVPHVRESGISMAQCYTVCEASARYQNTMSHECIHSPHSEAGPRCYR